MSNQSNSQFFTVVFIDVDDTMIPTSMNNAMLKNFGIILFDLLSSSSLNILQSEIISSIKSIRNIVQKQNINNNIIYCIVSNAESSWLHYVLTSSKPKFNILGKFFKDNNINILSAPEEANKINVNNNHKNNQNIYKKYKWMAKYATFGQFIANKELLLNKKCNRLISIGDGEHEQKASEMYSIRNKNIDVINIRFIEASTINQLKQQWKSIKNILTHIIETKSNNNKRIRNSNYFGCTLNDLFQNDNNILCIGSFQLKAFETYFKTFINFVKRHPQHQQESVFTKISSYIQKNVCSVGIRDQPQAKMVQIRKLVHIASTCTKYIQEIKI